MTNMSKDSLVEMLLEAVEEAIDLTSGVKKDEEYDHAVVREVLETGTVTVIKSIIEHGDKNQKKKATDLLKNIVLQREGSDKIKAAMLLLAGNKKTKALEEEKLECPKKRII